VRPSFTLLFRRSFFRKEKKRKEKKFKEKKAIKQSKKQDNKKIIRMHGIQHTLSCVTEIRGLLFSTCRFLFRKCNANNLRLKRAHELQLFFKGPRPCCFNKHSQSLETIPVPIISPSCIPLFRKKCLQIWNTIYRQDSTAHIDFV